MPAPRQTMAIVYDFDGTLAPGNMQEHQFIPDIGMQATEFWREVNELSRRNQADRILMYMYVMLRKARAAGLPVRKEDFRKRGEGLRLFDGVAGWFGRISKYGQGRGVDVGHYLVSSGNAEIIEGSGIAGEFKEIYASKFLFDENGEAAWPALAINYTNKTQYLFRISKGAHDLSDETRINAVMPKNERPVPFENMVYVGDGTTDVPAFRVMKDQGGLSIAVFAPGTVNPDLHDEQFRDGGRIHRAVPADYTDGSELDAVIKQRIAEVAVREPHGARLPVR